MELNILKLLQKKGYKLTNSRRQILSILNAKPVSVSDIQETLKHKSVSIDIVTIYRNLELLVNLGFMQKTQFADKSARYEIVVNNVHHHHLICKNCGDIEDIPLDEKSLLSEVAKRSKFKIEKHNLEFFGICIQCQS